MVTSYPPPPLSPSFPPPSPSSPPPSPILEAPITLVSPVTPINLVTPVTPITPAPLPSCQRDKRASFSYLTLYRLIVNESSGLKRRTHHIFYSVQKIAVVQGKKRVVLTLLHHISDPKSLISLQPTKAFMRLS